MKKFVNKLLVIVILVISYIIINLICGNAVLAVNQTTSTDINSIDSNQYPQIKEMLQSLKSEHPNWNFKILYTDINWYDAIANEYVGHGGSPSNLVPANNSNYAGEWICKVCGSDKKYDSGSWCCASEKAIAYMMDARNSLNNSDIFQFLELSYSECSAESIKSMVSKTFLDSDSCVNAIIEAAQTHNVNAYYIVARILQEQGATGSTLSKGQGYAGKYVGVYNVFNIGASGNGKETVILNGLARAEKEGWTTLESSIIGGTKIIAKNYIARGQNTLYLQKFDVDNSDGDLYWHQYMQNILAAQKEGQTLRKTFDGMGCIEGSYTFLIPVFKNMPGEKSPRPPITNSNETINTDLVKVNVSGSLYLREAASKDANKIGSVYKDEILTRLEKATTKVDGTYWDYVMKADGTRGYAARETYESEATYKLYLVPVNSDSTETQPDNNENQNQNENENENENTTVLLSDKVKVDMQNKSVTTIPNATVKDLSDLLGQEVVAKNSKGEVLSSDAKLGTGCVINDIYTVVVLGDVNGDGTVDARDSLRILKYSVGTYELKNEFSIASDLNKDSVIDARDSLRILKHSVETYEIKL